MSDRLLWIGQDPALAWRVLALFRERPDLELQVSLTGLEGLRLVLQRFTPQMVLIAHEILSHPDADAYQSLLAKAGNPPLIVVQSQAADLPPTALAWGALDVLHDADTAHFFERLELVLPLSRHHARTRLASPPKLPSTAWRVLILGASTGGPQALAAILRGLPADFPVPIVVVQHLPGHWTRSLAERLHAISALTVREVQQQDRLQVGQVLVVPGRDQLRFHRNGNLSLYQEADWHCPSVDAALISATEAFGGQVMTAILTGMGNDGLEGAKRLRQVKGFCLAEHVSSCVVYGMPRAVIEAQCADRVIPLSRIAQELQQWATGRN